MRVEGKVIRKGKDERQGLISIPGGNLLSLPVQMYLSCWGHGTEEEQEIFFKGYYGLPSKVDTTGKFSLVEAANLTRLNDAYQQGRIAAFKAKNLLGKVALEVPDELPEQGVFD